ncbi:MAG: DEAD/DEAH box helicase [Nanoarchaeota archaeon]|nr:DEAD/DEAH box helicase [Nanoarchaeota archaeon]
MKLLDIKDKIPKELYDKLSIEEFRPPQELAIKKGLLDGKNLVVASPTASGKTLVAEIAIVNNILKKGGKAIYLTPLKSLASEKYNEFKEKYPFLNVMLSIGDYDSSDPWLQKADIIVCSNEKLDSLMRHNIPWIREVNTIVIDEIHVLDQPDRGPTLEILITRLKEFCKNAQIIALSATIQNAKELAEWLNANLVKSNYRPVELEYGVYLDGKLYFEDKVKNLPEAKTPEHQIIKDTLDMKKQILVFLSSRRNAEAVAKNAKLVVEKYLTREEKEKLEKLSNEILHVLESPTRQCEILSECVKCGTAFHHAGLVGKQQRMIEDAFKQGLIKLISATPTLSFGVNLPSHTVLVRDLKRYSPDYGSNWIPVLEVQQMFGRAGRPKFDREGRALMIARSEIEKDEIFEKYVKGDPEEIYSKLSAEPILRMQVLGLIASGEVSSKENLLKFFSKTFFAKQYADLEKIEVKLDKVIELLLGYGFITIDRNKLLPTQIGKRVAELYIDPESAHLLIEKIKQKRKSEMFWLHSICSCTEMFPLLRVSPKEFTDLQKMYLDFSSELDEPSPWELDYEIWIRAFKTSLMLFDWINEKTEARILEEYKETPGVLRNRLYIADWLLYSAYELARILKAKELLLPLNKLRLRVKNGVKEELLNLLQLEGIGRVRARKLYRAGIKKISDIRKAPQEKLAGILGPKIAIKIKKQV